LDELFKSLHDRFVMVTSKDDARVKVCELKCRSETDISDFIAKYELLRGDLQKRDPDDVLFIFKRKLRRFPELTKWLSPSENILECYRIAREHEQLIKQLKKGKDAGRNKHHDGGKPAYHPSQQHQQQRQQHPQRVDKHPYQKDRKPHHGKGEHKAPYPKPHERKSFKNKSKPQFNGGKDRERMHGKHGSGAGGPPRPTQQSGGKGGDQ
jgi:hypothetical protein